MYATSEIEARYSVVPVYIVEANELYQGSHNEESFRLSFVQMSCKKSFSELKKRIADVITALKQKTNPDTAMIRVDAIRLWLGEDKAKLLASFDEISKCE